MNRAPLVRVLALVAFSSGSRSAMSTTDNVSTSRGQRCMGYETANRPCSLFRAVVVASGSTLEAVRMASDGRRMVILTTATGVPIVVEADGSLTVSGQPGQGKRLAQLGMEEQPNGTFLLRYEDRYVAVSPDGVVSVSKGSSVPGTLFHVPAPSKHEFQDVQTLDGRPLGVVEAAIWISDSGRVAPNYAWQTGIATYVGTDALQYIDSAVMLGLSLQKLVPEYPRVCMVASTMPIDNRNFLASAGWTLVELETWHVNQTLDIVSRFSGPPPPFDSFAKLNSFRLNMRRVLWMDSDMLLYSPRLREVLNDKTLPQGFIAMVRDCADDGRVGKFNSGNMFFKPEYTTFSKIVQTLESFSDSKALDQAVVNAVYAGRIKELPSVFNYHGASPPDESCSGGIVVGHFTGPQKASTHNQSILEGIRLGRMPRSGIKCPDLYRDYYCRLQQHRTSLSPELQMMLKSTGPCLGGLTYDASTSTTTTTTSSTSTSTLTGTSRLSLARLRANEPVPLWTAVSIFVVAAIGGVCGVITILKLLELRCGAARCRSDSDATLLAEADVRVGRIAAYWNAAPGMHAINHTKREEREFDLIWAGLELQVEIDDSYTR